MDYETTKQAFDSYINECRKRIKDTFFHQDYLLNFKALRNHLIESGRVNKEISVEDAIKFERLEMIDTKINHTMRIVEDVLRIAKKMGTPIDFNNLLKISALLHDIGRFDQATWNNDFNDICYKDIVGIKNHAQAGYHILFKNNRIDNFGIDKRYYIAVGSVVYNHGNPVLTGELGLKFNSLQDLDIDLLRGLDTLNYDEKVIVATLVQMVRDVDMLDILYQSLTGDIPVIKKDVDYYICEESISDIAKYWDINPKDLLDYNGIKEEDLIKMEIIKVPVDKIDLRKLEVPVDIKEKFFQNEHIDLQELRRRRDWTFITGMWWKLNHFLNNINFTSNLKLIEEKQLLDRIYEKYPDEYKFLVSDAFSFAKEYLIKDQLDNNSDSVYTKTYRQV